MFLSAYNDLSVYGVTKTADQNRLIKSLADYREQVHTSPILVSFYEKENWTERRSKNGAVWGKRGPERLLRVVTLR